MESYLEIDKSLLSKENVVDFGILPNVYRLTASRIVDQFERKRCPKKRKDVHYKLLSKYFQKYFVVHERSPVKYSFSPYVWSKVDSCSYNNIYSVRDRAICTHDFSSLIRSRDTDDHICHCMSTQKVHLSIVKMIVKF